jgi:hypothetical protein
VSLFNIFQGVELMGVTTKKNQKAITRNLDEDYTILFR